jgi:hypothetical protein
VLQRVVVSDTTIEKLAEILEDNPRGTLVGRDELAGWLGSFTRYKGRNSGSDLPNWLEMHRAGTVIIDRRTAERKLQFIPRASVSVTGGIQPGVLARVLTAEFLDAGLAARLLMAMPPKQAKRWTEAEVPPEVEEAYAKILDKLLTLEGDKAEDQRTPVVLRLSGEAKACWVLFYNQWGQEQAVVEGDLAAAFSKLEGYAARFGLIHHVVTHVWLETEDVRDVGVKSVEAGIRLARWFAGEADRLYRTFSESAEECETRRLVEFIRGRGSRITVKELQRSNNRKYPASQVAELALEGLVGGGLGVWSERRQGQRGGRPTRDFILHPTHDETDETPADEEGGESGSADATADETRGAGDDTAEYLGENGVSSVSSCVVHNFSEHEKQAKKGLAAASCDGEVSSCDGEVSSCGGEVSSCGVPPYLVVRDAAGLEMVRTALGDTTLVGLDLETTGLDPRTDRVRLLSLATDTIDGGAFVYLVDCFAIDPGPLWEALTEQALVGHNLQFDLGFLARHGFWAGEVHDTMLASQVLHAGEQLRHTLGACADRELGLALDKAEQKSDWSGTLTDAQLAYAARDAAVLAPLYRALDAKVRQARLEEALAIEEHCLPAVVWMAHHGVPFDREHWQTLAQDAAVEADRLARELDALAPSVPGVLVGRWNWDSPADVKKVLTQLGFPVEGSGDDALAGIDHPLAGLLRQYREARKRTTTYGRDWLQHVAAEGRVYTHWNQLGARTGRMSSGTPNLQNIPRVADYRRCFAAPLGRVLVKADYSQIELRIAAKIANERAMIDAYLRGDDLHTLTARQLTGRQDVSKKVPLVGPPPWYTLPEFFPACPHCGAALARGTWAHLVLERRYAWMELDGYVGRPSGL